MKQSPTTVLIVHSNMALGDVWMRHLERQNMSVERATSQDAAIDHLACHDTDIIILDLVLDKGSALAVSDYANFRHPKTQVVFVTNTSFFSDGSIFAHSSNARAFLPSTTPPKDLAAMVAYYGS